MALLEHKARNLDEAIRNLEPVHSLEVGELRDYYVEREHSPIKRMLSEEQLSLLRDIQRKRNIDQTEAYQNLLHTLSVLEYENDELWYDVSPLVANLLID